MDRRIAELRAIVDRALAATYERLCLLRDRLKQARPPRVGRQSARTAIAFFMIFVGLGRLGLYTFRSVTLGPQSFYGFALILLATALLLTGGRKAYELSGRVHAGVSAGLLTALGVDVWYTLGGVNTSAVSLLLFAYFLVLEAGARYDRTH